MQKPIISADSHITEPPNTYTDRIDHKYKDSAPHMIHDEKLGDVFIVKDFPRPINVALAAAAGKDASELRTIGAKFDEMHRGGWDPIPERVPNRRGRLAGSDGTSKAWGRPAELGEGESFVV